MPDSAYGQWSKCVAPEVQNSLTQTFAANGNCPNLQIPEVSERNFILTRRCINTKACKASLWEKTGLVWLGSHQFSINFPPVHFLASLTTAFSGDPKKYLSSPVLYLGPSRRLCSDIRCFSPQKHLNCLKTPKNVRTFEDTHHSDWGQLQAIREWHSNSSIYTAPGWMPVDQGPWGSIYSIGSGNMMFFMMI